jgi:hypothetical protein
MHACMQKHYPPKKKKKKAAVTQTHVACEQKGFTCEHQDITMSKRGTNDKQKEQIGHELCKYVHTNITEVLVGGDTREDGFVTPSHTSESVLNKGFHTIWEEDCYTGRTQLMETALWHQENVQCWEGALNRFTESFNSHSPLNYAFHTHILHSP